MRMPLPVASTTDKGHHIYPPHHTMSLIGAWTALCVARCPSYTPSIEQSV